MQKAHLLFDCVCGDDLVQQGVCAPRALEVLGDVCSEIAREAELLQHDCRRINDDRLEVWTSKLARGGPLAKQVDCRHERARKVAMESGQRFRDDQDVGCNPLCVGLAERRNRADATAVKVSRHDIHVEMEGKPRVDGLVERHNQLSRRILFGGRLFRKGAGEIRVPVLLGHGGQELEVVGRAGAPERKHVGEESLLVGRVNVANHELVKRREKRDPSVAAPKTALSFPIAKNTRGIDKSFGPPTMVFSRTHDQLPNG